MELIPNIRFNTLLVVCVFLPVLAITLVFQPSELVVGILFGVAVVVGFAVLFWHSNRVDPFAEQDRRRARGS